MPQIGVWEVHGTEIEELIRQGMSMAEAGRRFGVSRERVRTLLVSHNLPTRAPMLKQKEVMALLGCSQRYLNGLEHKGLVTLIHSGLKPSTTYYSESELIKIKAIMGERWISRGRQKRSKVVVTQPP
jgi:hypothetical protein